MSNLFLFDADSGSCEVLFLAKHFLTSPLACLNVGVETGQGLQFAGHRDQGGGEAHDHFMARVMSAMI